MPSKVEELEQLNQDNESGQAKRRCYSTFIRPTYCVDSKVKFNRKTTINSSNTNDTEYQRLHWRSQ